jgi:hypothetical protein
MSDRNDTKFWIGLAIVLFGPGYATQLESQAAQQTDPHWRRFYLGAARVVRDAAKDPEGATDALESLWDQVFEGKTRRRRPKTLRKS